MTNDVQCSNRQSHAALKACQELAQVLENDSESLCHSWHQHLLDHTQDLVSANVCTALLGMKLTDLAIVDTSAWEASQLVKEGAYMVLP